MRDKERSDHFKSIKFWKHFYTGTAINLFNIIFVPVVFCIFDNFEFILRVINLKVKYFTSICAFDSRNNI